MSYGKYPMIYTLASLKNRDWPECQLPDGRWVPARPLGFASLLQRFRCAWLVFTGKADALTWPGQ